MPLVALRLSNNLNKGMSRAVRGFGGKPGKEMKRLARGIAIGFVKTIKGRKGKTRPSGGRGRPGKGIKGVSAGNLAKEILKQIRKELDASQNPVQKALFAAICKALVKEMGQAMIRGGAAGNVSKFKGWNGTQMGRNMQKATGFRKTRESVKLFKAIGNGITFLIQRKGKAKIPRAGGGSGSTTATIS